MTDRTGEISTVCYLVERRVGQTCKIVRWKTRGDTETGLIAIIPVKRKKVGYYKYFVYFGYICAMIKENVGDI